MMRQLVRMQVRLLVESFVAALERADKWLLARMNPHVRLQVEVEGESFVTQFTFIRFFTLELT